MLPRKPARPATLRRRFLTHNLLLVCCLLLAGAVSVWRLGVLRSRVDVSRNVYAELRTVASVGVDVGLVRGLLSDPAANRQAIDTQLTYAIGGLDQFIQVGSGYGEGGMGDRQTLAAYEPINAAAAAARGRLENVLEALRSGERADPGAWQRQVDGAMNDLDQVAGSCIRFLTAHQEAASGAVAANVVWIGLLSLAAVAAAVWMAVGHDRLVIAPLQRLREGVRRVAEARFATALDPAGMAATPEFLDLAEEFNHMAAELDGFYRRLEEQVRAKSRELVRSERLASVGFLAAGVAHEINNPLNIISGYAELTDRALRPAHGPPDADALDQARDSLRVIRDEAFRCKEITEKLLSLARNGGDSRQPLDLSGVARDVAAMTQGLKNYRDRRLRLDLDPAERLEVEANLTEMKQVLLNLTINALEAAPPGEGEVCIVGRRTREWVELRVEDNGRGMSADVLTHVFEPFFTARRSDGIERGTGLGLSITHAIVESHGGRIEAESDGPGRGARFTVRLPARRAHRLVGAV